MVAFSMVGGAKDWRLLQGGIRAELGAKKGEGVVRIGLNWVVIEKERGKKRKYWRMFDLRQVTLV